MFSVFYSNRIEILLESLKNRLFVDTKPFSRRLVIVPSPLMKSWLVWHLANDPKLGIAMGIEFCYVNEAITKLSKICSMQMGPPSPSLAEIALALDVEIRKIIIDPPSDERELWLPLFQYLGVDRRGKKFEKRIIGICEHLAQLFHQYGIFAGEMLQTWEKTRAVDWQQRLWQRLYQGDGQWSYPYRQLQKECVLKHSQDIHVHIFAMSFIPRLHFNFFSKIAKCIPLQTYLLSPCEAFWSDLCSDSEALFLHRQWEKQGISLSQQLDADTFLMDRNPLLANCGRLGREMAKMVEESSAEIDSTYQLADEDLGELTLLEALQSDIVLLRNPDQRNTIPCVSTDQSLTVHVAVSQMREVEILYNNIMQVIDRHRQDDDPICPSDIVVMAPDITQYESMIKAVFGGAHSTLDIQMYDVQTQSQQSVVQGFMCLMEIAEGRWEVQRLIRLFEYPEVQRRLAIGSDEIQLLRSWVKEAKIKWGYDLKHRKKLLDHNDFQEGGSWQFGLRRTLLGLLVHMEQGIQQNLAFDISVDGIPMDDIDFTQGKTIGKWIRILKSLYHDLKPLSDNVQMTLTQWVSYLKSLLDAYFSVEDGEEDENVRLQLDSLLRSSRHFQQNTFSWMTIRQHLINQFQQQTVVYRENHTQAVRFCSMLPMRAIPAKVICLLGLNEEVFPKKVVRDPLNFMAKTKQHDYCPKPPEYDRYLFLEAILSARRYFLISYVETQTSCANKTSFPSLLVTELLSYLDGSYEFKGQKVSDVCVIKHPFYPFDSKYFSGKNYSQRLYQSALAYYHHKKRKQHSIIGGWNIEEYDKKVEDQFIDIADLIRFAKNPLKTYFNKTLGVYLEHEEEISDVEEFTLSPLEKYIIKQDLQHHALDDVFTFREKMGKMPPGIFQKVEKQKMDKIDVVKDDSIVVEFDPDTKEVTCVQENVWKVPSIETEVNHTKVCIVGRMENITKTGLWIYGEGKPKDLYKHWPQCLLMNYLGNISQQQAIMAKNGKTVSIQFSECDEMVKNYVHMYWTCLYNIPLVIPEWTDDLQSHDLRSFKRKAQKHLSETYNEYLTFVFNEEVLEDMPDHYFNEWKKIAEQTYGSETKYQHIRS